MARYPGSTWRPIARNVGGALAPRAALMHTAADAGAPDHSSLFAWFNSADRKGTSAHGFIAGDGSMEQYIDSFREAGHAWDANSFSLGFETHDGGHPENPWSPAQVLRIVDLMHWCRDTLHIPIQPITGEHGAGWGYHEEFPAWNKSHHDCPGHNRVAQLPGIISLAAAVHPYPVGPPATPPANVPPAPIDWAAVRRLSAASLLPWLELLQVPVSNQTPAGSPIVLVQKVVNLIDQAANLALSGVYDQPTGIAVWKFQLEVNGMNPKAITDIPFPGVLTNDTKFWMVVAVQNVVNGQ